MLESKPVKIISLLLAVLLLAGVVVDALYQKTPPPVVEDAVSEATDDVQTEPVVEEFEPNPALKAAHDADPGAVGWLTLPGCDIDNVVFQSTDNDYYLRRDEAGNYSVWGCYFLDYINVNDGTFLPDRVSIIYGHSLEDLAESDRFSKLKRYRDASFAAENPTITFSLIGGSMEYEIFTACNIPVSLDYIDPLPDDAKFLSQLDYMLSNSYYDFGVTVGVDDRILVLSTCTSNPDIRFIVAGRLLTD